MNNYTDADRKMEVDFFISNYQDFSQQYGQKFLAIRNCQVLGAFDSVLEAIQTLSTTHELGTYIIQECTGDESAYRTTIMRLLIKG